MKTQSMLRTWCWFNIQQSQVLRTDGWFTDRLCVGLYSWIAHQKTWSRLTHQSMIWLGAMWRCG